MTGYVYFVFISSEFFYILESPSNGLCGIFRVGRILGTRAESVVYGYHGVALLPGTPSENVFLRLQYPPQWNRMRLKSFLSVG